MCSADYHVKHWLPCDRAYDQCIDIALYNEGRRRSQQELDGEANCGPADPPTHLSVPLTPADCAGVFITHCARGISQSSLLRGVCCSLCTLLSRHAHICISALDSFFGPLLVPCLCLFGGRFSTQFILLPHTNHTLESYDLLTLKIHGGNEYERVEDLGDTKSVQRFSELGGGTKAGGRAGCCRGRADSCLLECGPGGVSGGSVFMVIHRLRAAAAQVRVCAVMTVIVQKESSCNCGSRAM